MHATESQELVYEDIDPDDGILLANTLNEDGEVERARPRLVSES